MPLAVHTANSVPFHGGQVAGQGVHRGIEMPAIEKTAALLRAADTPENFRHGFRVDHGECG
jgi:hypothetical protein